MDSVSKQNTEWKGKAHFEAGIGVFCGNSGHNHLHRHWAHQIVIGLEGDVTVHSTERSYSGRALWVEAGHDHSLEESRLLSIYLDPLHTLTKHLYSFKKEPTAAFTEITELAYADWINLLVKQEGLNKFVEYLKKQYWQPSSVSNARLEKILLLVNRDIIEGRDTTRSKLASVANLSPSRFSHWFTEQTGIPLRSYKKWSRMLRGVELATQMSLTDAAINAGFSDHAHFCRTVVAALGVNPVSVKKILVK